MQFQFLRRRAVNFQNLIARQNARLRRRGVFHWCDNGEDTIFGRDFDTQSVEAAAGIVLHVAKIVRLHELAVGIERSEHPLHRGIDEIVITRLVTIHIILSQQLYRFGEDRDLRVAAVRVIFRRVGGEEPQHQ